MRYEKMTQDRIQNVSMIMTPTHTAYECSIIKSGIGTLLCHFKSCIVFL